MRTLLLSSGLVALMAAPHAARAQSQDKAYCVESQGGTRNCLYESRQLCQQDVGVRTTGGHCVMNPARFGTVGAGGMDPPRGTGTHSMDRVPAPAR
jgi:hypothetical protein